MGGSMVASPKIFHALILALALAVVTSNHHGVLPPTLAYHSNPRAIHPQGRLPTTIQAKKRFDGIQRDMLNMIMSSNEKGDPAIILVDGNNIRNSYGFQSVSATDLTNKLSHWIESMISKSTDTDTSALSSALSKSPSTSMPQVICIWDGGTKRCSQQTNSILSVFSGTDGNADNLIVQCCSFLTACTNKSSQLQNQNILIFTSDANLANRCQMQIMDGNKSGILEFKIYHSIYLHLLLDGEIDVHGINALVPDWEREERRTSVEELQQLQTRDLLQSLDVCGGKKVHEKEPMNSICEWINGGLVGLKIGRVTKGGSILYKMEEG